MQWTGGTWSLMSTPTRETIVGIWGSSDANVFAVGSNGTILALRRQRMDFHAERDDRGVARHVVGAGRDPRLRDGRVRCHAPLRRHAVVRGMPNDAGASEIWGIWGWSPTNLMAVGQNGALLHWDGSLWTVMATPVNAPCSALGRVAQRCLRCGRAGLPAALRRQHVAASPARRPSISSPLGQRA